MTNSKGPRDRFRTARRAGFTVLGVAAVVLGVISTGWLIGMVDQWLIPWSSLSVTAPPK